MRASLARRTLLPPPFPEPLGDAELRGFALAKTGFLVFAILIDVGIFLAFRGSPRIRRSALEAFAGINIGLLLVDLGLTLVARRRRPLLRPLLLLTILLEMFTIVVWIQVTGIVSSYFLLAGVILILAYRLALDHRAGMIAFATLAALHIGAFLLEETGVLRPAALFAHSGSPYDLPVFRWAAMPSILFLYLAAIMAANLVVVKLSEKDEALRAVRRELARAEAGARHGRLTGTTVAGAYELGELLGRGGMGEIYRARRLADGHEVAVKVLHPHLVEDEVMLERFRREATAAARLPGRHVAEILDVGADDEGQRYIVMEYLRGEDLAAFLRRHDTLSAARVAELAGEIAEALDAAHDAGIVHRDLKPQNVFLVAGGGSATGTDRAFDVRLLDFGISKLRDATVAMTRTAAVMGTPGFMAPEQARGDIERIGPASDVFALGTIAYRALTGRLAFPSADPVSAIYQVIERDPAPPSTLGLDLHPDVDLVLALALAKNPGSRYARASQFAADLARAAEGALDDATRARARQLDAGRAETVAG